MIPSNLSDFNLYGGLYRHVNLVYAPSLSIENILATAQVDEQGNKGNLSIQASVYNPYKQTKAQATVVLLTPEGDTLTTQQQELDLSIGNTLQLQNISVMKPVLWHPETPRLYQLILTLNSGVATCTQTTRFGFRHVGFVRHGPFMLNGKRLLLRGTQRHEDHAGVGAAMQEEQVRQELLLIKQMGANFIRLGHFQQSRLVLQLCDSLGLLVWEEIPWCRGGLGGQAYQQQAKQMLTNMIVQHYNHPSVIVWGLGNENDWPNDFKAFEKDSIRSFMQQLNQLAHTIDSNRFTVIRRCEFCSDITDLYSPSLWRGWYKGYYTEYRQATWEEVHKVPHFLHAEWGGDSHAGRHSEKIMSLLQDASPDKDTAYFNTAARQSKNGDWSETYICDLMDWTLKEQERMPWLTGAAQWIFKDFATPIRPQNPLPYINQKGLVQRDLTPKESYYVFQSYWATQPMVHIYGHSWPIRWGKYQESKLVKVYSNCDEVELLLNGQSMGNKKRNSQDFPAAGLRWNLSFTKGQNKLVAIARKGQTIITDTISFTYQTATWGKPARMLLRKIKATPGIATVQVQLTDAHGIPCLDAADVVRFGLTGDGSLPANLGTTTGSRQLQLSNGAAVININTNGGKSVVSVQCAGLPTAFLNL
jgi:beta-galactosidase